MEYSDSLSANTFVEILVLFLLSKKPMYTYDLAKEIKAIGGDILPVPRLYNTTAKLRVAGMITEAIREVAGNRARVYYKITDRGEEHLRRMTGILALVNDVIGSRRSEFTEGYNDSSR